MHAWLEWGQQASVCQDASPGFVRTTDKVGTQRHPECANGKSCLPSGAVLQVEQTSSNSWRLNCIE
eukprot:scaffold106581_cov20-Tisochrysis_lutea.AAC.7